MFLISVNIIINRRVVLKINQSLMEYIQKNKNFFDHLYMNEKNFDYKKQDKEFSFMID